MAAETPSVNQPNHLRRIFYIWIVLSVVGDLLFWFLVGPHIPPGRMTSSARSDQFDFNVLAVIGLPVIIGVWEWLGYTAFVWSSRNKNAPESVGGPKAAGNRRVETSWIVITSVVVIFLAGFGTVELIAGQGSGGGEGPNPIWEPSGTLQAETAAINGTASWSPNKSEVLPVQVIAQQWKFTYRYPTFGGFESSYLILPNDTNIAFNVTSLDVIHSFWAYQLEVKADANPMENNVAFTKTEQLGSFEVRCAELCGIWHGAMDNSGQVVSQAAFDKWATTTEAAQATNTKDLPPFAWTYVPDANGAAGGYYPDGTVTPYSPVEIYGAKQPS